MKFGTFKYGEQVYAGVTPAPPNTAPQVFHLPYQPGPRLFLPNKRIN